MALIIYVDDMIVPGDDKEEISRLKDYLAIEFEMKDLGGLKYFLGIEVARSKQDQVVEIARMGKSTVLDSLMRFCFTIEALYNNEYLRKPTTTNLQMLLKKGEMRGFPGMIGSIDLFDEMLQGKAPKVTYWVNDHKYKGAYYIPNDIYPRWTTFVKTVPHPQSEKEKHFAKCQEGCMKDVERYFGILQVRWAIVRAVARMFDVEAFRSIMKMCIILHSMIVEDEYDYDAIDEYEPETMNNSKTRIVLMIALKIQCNTSH
ncbi:uncharacterized protein [Malus domestica]|uniref:uncharacterized protein n=1 Tax=Malus domestica TaxID=3750 RepID=UPI003975180E